MLLTYLISKSIIIINYIINLYHHAVILYIGMLLIDSLLNHDDTLRIIGLTILCIYVYVSVCVCVCYACNCVCVCVCARVHARIYLYIHI